MIGTLFSFVMSALLWFYSMPEEGSANATLGKMMIALSVPFLFFMPIATMIAWLPMQKAEQNSTPRILEMLRKDTHIHLASAWFVIFFLASLIAAIDLFKSNEFDKRVLMAWIVLLGISIDVMRYAGRRITNYLNPFSVVKMFTEEAKKSIQQNRELDLCHWIDALSEVAVKGVQHHSTAIANMVLGEEQDISRLFLDASKSIAHPTQDEQTKSLGISDKVSYTMFYLYQRLDLIFDSALRHKLETTCSYIITFLGKNSIDAAKYDVSLASAPLRFLGKFAVRAQGEGLEETALTASCIYSEVAKALIKDIDITYYEIKDPFLSIINGMELLAKGAFRRDKTMNISLLIQPFKELRALFETGKAKDHQDAPVIVQNIDRVIGEFEELLIVMKTLPPLPKIEEAEIPK